MSCHAPHPAPNPTVFLTLATCPRMPWLHTKTGRHLVMRAMHIARNRHPYRHLAHALLDDRVHLLLELDDERLIPALVACLKHSTTVQVKPAGPLWQRRYVRHVIRNARDLQRHLDYMCAPDPKHGPAECAVGGGRSSVARWEQPGICTPSLASRMARQHREADDP